ncbi:SAM-dependent methyltransferase [Candidatus Thiosymbion oneisti]|uniref:SAM-dependent methyltransferase n=1 Tax=Candidatus Thiosymbion oneisti TaxID=589554 RepID=UPI000B7EE367|nr:class I SAM-dependent methyltransferase [Candidatus Thiosymbion oneisti]
MTVGPEEPFDLDGFYSLVSIDEWKRIIGDALHYHFGYFRGSEDLETGLRQTVKNFYPYIVPGSRILDVGCGWGGPGKMLIAERDCRVTGVTCSTAQADYCRGLGLKVLRHDLDRDTEAIPGEYDLIFSLEMISHVRNKFEHLRRLRANAPRLILSESCAADGYRGERATYGGSIMLCTVSELICDMEKAGWQIKVMRNRRFESLRTIALWKRNLDRVYGDREPPGQLSYLRGLVNEALKSPVAWCHSFPLIDIVAEKK